MGVTAQWAGERQLIGLLVAAALLLFIYTRPLGRDRDDAMLLRNQLTNLDTTLLHLNHSYTAALASHARDAVRTKVVQKQYDACVTDMEMIRGEREQLLQQLAALRAEHNITQLQVQTQRQPQQQPQQPADPCAIYAALQAQQAEARYANNVFTSSVAAGGGGSGGGSGSGSGDKVLSVPLYCQKLHVVIAAYDKDVQPLRQRLTADAWPFTLYNHRDENSADYLGPNKIDEVHAFLRFVVDHYDHLPEVVALVQDDAVAQAPTGLDHFKCLRLSAALPYTTLITCYAPWRMFDRHHFAALVNILRAEGAVVADLPGDADKLYYNCCAYFAVGRDIIRRFSLNVWRAVLEFGLTRHTATHTIGLVFEHAWHVMFGDQWRVLDIENNLAESCVRYLPNCTYRAPDTNFCSQPHKKQGQRRLL